jgi:hypothetical protein
VAVARWRRCVAAQTAARGRQRTLVLGRGGLGKCRGLAICVRARVPGEAPDGRRGSRSAPGGGPTSRALYGTLAGRTKGWGTKFLLRDHARPQPLASAVVAAKRRRADGAHVRPRPAWLWPLCPDAVWPAAAPPASAGPGAGIRRLGSNAGSNTAACTGGHSLCAGRAAPAVVADWTGSGRLAYHDNSPRECVLPRDSSGRTR